MQVVNRVWSAVSIYVEAISFLAALLCFFTFATPQANASTFGDSFKTNAVSALLSLFGTDSATIHSVAAVLNATAGTVSVSTDASSPAFQVYPGNASGVTLGVFKVRATGENVTLTRLGLLLQSGAPADISSIDIYNGAVLLGSAAFLGSNTTATSTFTTPLVLPMDTDVLITVRGSFTGIGAGLPATSGDWIRVNPFTYEAIGGASGATVRGATSASTAGVRIFRSYPTILLDGLSANTLNAGSAAIMRFKVVANGAGPVSMGALNFSSLTQNASLSNITLSAYTDSAYSLPVSGQGASGQIGSTSAAGGEFAILPASPLMIPAGATYYFELRATVQQTGSVSAFAVSTTLKGDSSYGGVGQWVTQKASGKFIWSPNSASASDYAANDWTNGYAIPGLPANGLVQSRSNGVSTPIPPALPSPTSTPTTTPPIVIPPTPTSTPTTTTPTGTPAPTCTLSADKTNINKHNQIKLTWTSVNATSASSQNGTTNNKVQGSIYVTPNEDTIYVKKVYGPGGQGSCQVQIDVRQDREGAPGKKVVFGDIGSYFSQLFSTMQVGAVVIGETYAEYVSGGAQ